MSARNAVFRFRLDVQDFITKGNMVVQTTGKIRSSSQSASISVDRMGQSFQRTGQSATTAAINFQTATQGMLNLSTAGIQTFTSFSNLDRAGNRLAMSTIAVARAQDLLGAKELRLIQLREKGGDPRKIIQLTNELATARADLAVKTNKQGIEEAALFDIQLLFVANIANVMISSVQTIVTLKNLHVAATIKQIIHEKVLGFTTQANNAKRLAAMPIMSGTITLTKLQTIATRGLLATLGPIAIVIGAISVGLVAYNQNWGGFRDIIQDLLPFLKDKAKLDRETRDLLKEQRVEQDMLNTSMQKMPQTIEELTKAYKKLNNEIAFEIQAQRNLNQIRLAQGFRSDFLNGSLSGANATSGTVNFGGPFSANLLGGASLFVGRATQEGGARVHQETVGRVLPANSFTFQQQLAFVEGRDLLTGPQQTSAEYMEFLRMTALGYSPDEGPQHTQSIKRLELKFEHLFIGGPKGPAVGFVGAKREIEKYKKAKRLYQLRWISESDYRSFLQNPTKFPLSKLQNVSPFKMTKSPTQKAAESLELALRIFKFGTNTGSGVIFDPVTGQAVGTGTGSRSTLISTLLATEGFGGFSQGAPEDVQAFFAGKLGLQNAETAAEVYAKSFFTRKQAQRNAASALGISTSGLTQSKGRSSSFGNRGYGNILAIQSFYKGDVFNQMSRSMRIPRRGGQRGGGGNSWFRWVNASYEAGRRARQAAGVARRDFNELIPLTQDIEFYNAFGNLSSIQAFQASLDALRVMREDFQASLGLSFRNQSNIEQDVLRGRDELEDRKLFFERLDAAGSGTSGF